MIPTMEMLLDKLQYIFDALANISQITASFPTTEVTISTLWNFLPFTPVLVYLWPILLMPLLVSISSASGWLFWIFTSLVVGSVQVFYACYQFGMIGIDIAVLSVLKTFALLRSTIRYYTIQSRSKLSPSNKNNKNQGNSGRGRRREWRMRCNKATNYKEFLMVEIQEPLPLEDDKKTRKEKDNIWWRKLFFPNNSDNNNGSKQKEQNLSTNEKNVAATTTIHRMSSSSPTRPKGVRRASSSPSNKIRRVNSYEPLRQDYDDSTTETSTIFQSIQKRTTTTTTTTVTPVSSPSRLSNRASQSTSNIKQQYEKHLEEEEYMKEIEKELHMSGSMLLTTTNRLREARLQASAYKRSGGSRRTMMKTSIQESNISNSEGKVVNDDDDDENMNSLGRISTMTHQQDDPEASLSFLLTGVVKRNHLSVDDTLIENGRSIMESGQHRLSAKARNVILGFNAELERCLDYVAQSTSSSGVGTLSPTTSTSTLPALNSSSTSKSLGVGKSHEIEFNAFRSSASDNNLQNSNHNNSSFKLPPATPQEELHDKINLLRKMKHNMGRTALMLSGGGAQAMYHLGTIKALGESDVYKDINVISGTSGGSIAAAMCATMTSEELLSDVCVSHVSTDFGRTGRMAKENIRWFPKSLDMVTYWLKHKLMVDSKEFKRCCDFYWGDVTFEEAFEKTGKHVCITVSASRADAEGGRGAQRLLLNHISTPHVTIASAVAASCALPGVMAPAKLVTKNSGGVQEPFEVDGVEWIDGSVQADLPFKRISTMFNVSNYIVCQTNFHVVPFLHKAHHPSSKSFYWRIFRTCEWDIRNRALNLSRLGLFPRMFGQDISKVFKQKYHGNLTLVPQFTTMQVFGLKALVNPTVEEMEIYLQNGQAAAWPYMSTIKEMLRIEAAIDRCISNVQEKARLLSGSNLELQNDDLVSLTSAQVSRTRMLSAHRKAELLEQKVHALELENAGLKKQLQKIHNTLGIPLQSPQAPTPDPNPNTPLNEIQFVPLR